MTPTAANTRGRSTGGATGQRRVARSAGPVEKAVRSDLKRIEKLDPELARGGLAASVVALAQEIDNADNSATSKSMCARALREALDRLLELAPPQENDDRIDDLQSRAAIKLARKPAP